MQLDCYPVDEVSEQWKSESATQQSVPNEGEDHLSNLHIDCLLEVLARLDHNDLDEVATVSKRMCALANLSRSKAAKVPADSLAISQTSPRGFLVELEYSKQFYFLQTTKSSFKPARQVGKTLLRRRSVGYEQPWIQLHDNTPKRQKVSGQFTSQASSLLSRFDFKFCRFDSISVDDNFLTYIERVISGRSLNTFLLANAAFDRNVTSNCQERLLSLLLSAKPKKISLDIVSDPPLIDETFLREYVDAVPLATLWSCSKEEKMEPYLAIRDAAEFLANYKDIKMPRLMIDAASTLPLIFRRLRQKVEGYWGFQMTNPLHEADINAALEPDMQYTSDEVYHCIQIIGTDHKVKIKKDEWDYLDATFISNEESEITDNNHDYSSCYEADKLLLLLPCLFICIAAVFFGLTIIAQYCFR